MERNKKHYNKPVEESETGAGADFPARGAFEQSEAPERIFARRYPGSLPGALQEEKRQGIKWSEVTWYSKTLALALFVALPFVGFYLGAQYQKIAGGIEIIGSAVSPSSSAAAQTEENNAANQTGGQNAQGQQAVAATTTPSAPSYTVALSYPYSVSWQGINGASIVLTGASLGQTALELNGQNSVAYALTLTMNVASGFGGFCTSAFASYGLRMVLNENGDVEAPALLDNNCVPSNSTLTSQRVAFPVSQTQKEIIITVDNPDGSQQTFLTIDVMDNGSLRVAPAPTQG